MFDRTSWMPLLGVCLLSLGVRAQAMTLPQALAWAHQHQPSLLASRARIAAAREEAQIPRALWAPRATAAVQVIEGTTNNTTASFAAPYGIDLVRIGGTRTSGTGSWSPDISSIAAIGVRQEVFDFGRIAVESAAADALADAAVARGDVVQLDIDLDIEEAFLAVNASKAVLRASLAALQRAEAHRDDAQAEVKSGLRRPIDLTRAQADVARFDVGRVRAQGAVISAQSLFAAAVGVPEPRLDALGDVPAFAVAPDVEHAMTLALANDPSLRAAKLLLTAQQQQTRAIGALSRPDLELSASLSGRAGGGQPTAGSVPNGGGYLPDVQNWDAGLMLTWPFFDPVINARQSASRKEEVVRESQADEVRANVVALVQEAAVALQTASDAIPALHRSVDAALANSAQADARSKAGLSSQLEVADADALLVDAEIQLALGEFEHARARARLGRVIAEAP